MISSRKLMITASVAAVLAAGAVPAKRDPYTVTQPDGTTLVLKKTGDEFTHFTMTADGCLVTRSDEGAFNYARIGGDGSIVDTGRRAVDAAVRTADDEAFIQRYDRIDMQAVKAARAMKSRSSARRSIAQSGLGRFTSDFPRTGDIRGLVILVEFKDKKFTHSSPHSYFNDLLNKNGFSEYGGTGCASEYFRQQSDNQFRPTFDLFGPVTLPNTMAYYGGNDSDGNDLHPEMMAVDAAALLDSEIDFSRYDMDGDGYVDNIFIFYAGQGEASYGDEDTVWPHAWDIESAGKAAPVHDGVKISRYACTNEWEKNRPDGVGTFIHEFSHVMGLPDLYHTADYDGTATYTPGAWSVMDYGPYNNNGCTPPAYSVYERNAMGWIDPEVLDGPATISLGYIGDTNKGCIIPTSSKNEFFLIENRQQKGWDAFVPGHGMLIWHIDFNQRVFDNNEVNNTRSHQYVDIEEANGYANSARESAMAGYPFPGTSGATSFTDDTTPSMKTWSGARLNLPITDIEESADGIISFNIAGGELLPTPVVQPVTETGDDYFIASWQPVEGAVDYLLTVKALTGNGEVTEETADMGSSARVSLPSGWTSTTTDSYITNGNYGKALPSLKLSSSGASVTTRLYDDDVAAIEFWMKGQNTSGGSNIAITGLVGQTWTDITTITPESGKGKTFSVDKIPHGVRQIRITYTKSSGNVAIDDIKVTTGGGDEIILDNVSTGGATSRRVDINRSRATDARRFSYSVVATDGTVKSRPSAEVIVDLDQSGISGVVNSASMDVVVDGNTVICSGAESPVVELFDISGRLLDRKPTVDGTARMMAGSRGIYILRAGNAVRKLTIR